MDGPRRQALCVGINDYPGDPDLKLRGCVNDATDWQAAIEGWGYGVRALHDRAATGEAIRRQLLALVEGARRGDSIAFVFAGHGSWVPDAGGDEEDGRDEVICPCDVATRGCLVDDDLAAIFRRKAAGVRLLFFADSCNSGSVAKEDPSLAPPAAFYSRARFLPPSTFVRGRGAARKLDRAAALPASRKPWGASLFGRPRDPGGLPAGGAVSRKPGPILQKAVSKALLFAACSDHEKSWDGEFEGRPNGAFSRAALDTLGSHPATPEAWMTLIRRGLPNARYPQSPRLFGSRSEMKRALDGVEESRRRGGR